MIISILTATWQYNLGDELILLEEYKILKEQFSDAKFNIFTYDKKSSFIQDEVNYVTYFPTWIRKKIFLNLKYLYQNILAFYKSDLIIIWWWWLIYDNEFQKSKLPILQWKFRIFLAKLFRKKVIYLAIWINIKEKNYEKIKYLFNWNNIYVSVRDLKSKLILKNLKIESSLIYDPVFLLSTKEENKFKTKTVWISLRKGYLKNEEENIKQMVLFLSRLWYKIIFLTHSFHLKDWLANDYEFLKTFSKKYKLWITNSLIETLSVYKKLDFVIAMRFHSIILSIIYNIPFLWLSYSQKTEEILKTISYKYFLNSKEFDFEKFSKLFSDLETKKDSIKFDLKTKTNKIKKQLKNIIINFLNYGLGKN